MTIQSEMKMFPFNRMRPDPVMNTGYGEWSRPAMFKIAKRTGTPSMNHTLPKLFLAEAYCNREIPG